MGNGTLSFASEEAPSWVRVLDGEWTAVVRGESGRWKTRRSFIVEHPSCSGRERRDRCPIRTMFEELLFALVVRACLGGRTQDPIE